MVMAAYVSTDPTFRSYNAIQAQSYLQGRISYPGELIRIICDHHKSTGGHFMQLLDVGCGPGNATRSFSPSFNRAIGCDPSVEMINKARSIPSRTLTPDEPIRFEFSVSEDIASIPKLEAGTVDLVTVASAAHWFDMPKFYTQAAQLLRPGGTIAIWAGGSRSVHPHNTPNYAEVQRILFKLEVETLGPYMLPGNLLCRGMYRELPLPWNVTPPVTEFPEGSFKRMEWNCDGEVKKGEKFFWGAEHMPLDLLPILCSTASPVTRWRDAHPDLVGTDQDCVTVTVKELREALDGQDWLEVGTGLVLLLIKNAAA